MRPRRASSPPSKQSAFIATTSAPALRRTLRPRSSSAGTTPSAVTRRLDSGLRPHSRPTFSTNTWPRSLMHHVSVFLVPCHNDLEREVVHDRATAPQDVHPKRKTDSSLIGTGPRLSAGNNIRQRERPRQLRCGVNGESVPFYQVGQGRQVESSVGDERRDEAERPGNCNA